MEKKESRHSKMYKDSPRIESDDSGKKVIKKGSNEAEKKSAEVNAGTEGVVKDDDAVMKLHQKHAKERMDMHHKHEKEHLSLMHKGMKHGAEGSAEEENSESKAEAAKEGD